MLPERVDVRQMVEPPPVEEVEPTQNNAAQDTNEHHFVYGKAGMDLYEENTSRMVARSGTKVCLVYPMTHNEETGRVTMRMKMVDPETAQLSYCNVCVYTGFDDDTRCVTDFSLFPSS